MANSYFSLMKILASILGDICKEFLFLGDDYKIRLE